MHVSFPAVVYLFTEVHAAPSCGKPYLITSTNFFLPCASTCRIIYTALEHKCNQIAIDITNGTHHVWWPESASRSLTLHHQSYRFSIHNSTARPRVHVRINVTVWTREQRPCMNHQGSPPFAYQRPVSANSARYKPRGCGQSKDNH